MGAGTTGAAQGGAQGALVGSAAGPVGTVVGAVIGAAAGYFAGKSAEKAAAKLTPEQRQMFNFIIQNVKTASEFGQFLTSISRDPIIASTNWLNTMASGDRNTLMEVVGKDVAGISDSARQSLQTMAQLAPRSVSTEFQSRMPFQTALAQNQVLTDTRNQARQAQLGAGLQLAQTGASALHAGSSGGQSAMDFLQRLRDNATAIGAGTASSTYNAISGLAQSGGDAYRMWQAGRQPSAVGNNGFNFGTAYNPPRGSSNPSGFGAFMNPELMFGGGGVSGPGGGGSYPAGSGNKYKPPTRYGGWGWG